MKRQYKIVKAIAPHQFGGNDLRQTIEEAREISFAMSKDMSVIEELIVLHAASADADIDEQLFAKSLALAGSPDPDLLIRTGGEQRISNFLLWNLAYSELFFCDCLWPDFTTETFDKALEFFSSRQRRYGNTGKQTGVA